MSLNDPRWGRGSDEPNKKDESAREDDRPQDRDERRDEREARNDARDGRDAQDKRDGRDGRQEDLDRLWGEFADMINGIMNPGGKRRRSGDDPLSKLKSRDDYSRGDESGEGDDRQGASDDRLGERSAWQRPADAGDGGNGGGNAGAPAPKNARWPGGLYIRQSNFGLGVIALCAVVGWAASGFYIVPEGQTGVVTTFGRYANSAGPGFNWHIPGPIQSVDLVDVSSVRTAQIGMRGAAERLREALMLTDDENIVDVQFNVQYRIKSGSGAKDFLFNTRGPDASVTQAAESAMREVVGRKTMDSVLFESKAEIAEAVKQSMQTMLDRYGTGIEVMSVAIQNAQPPEQVQAAFNDAVKAGQDRERAINLGEAYMNAVIPKAQGTASRLKEEAEGYKARAVETARGDADRYGAVFNEYRKAPEVTRDRIYVDTMRDIYSSVSKVYVDQKSGSNLLYLPLDRIVASTRAAAASDADASAAAGDAAQAASGQADAAAAQASSQGAYSGAAYRTEDEPRALVRSRTR